ncbi:MAG TPA: NAD(P)-binding domain-containing protein [Polyangiaceae bacterium]|jgi:predicted dinucleotide-binding enzyme|nr:NAD(P)-binding domain-containing protein [Polyangiaceae bacterium]
MTRIAIVGAGNVGGNLGVTLAGAGYSVAFGVRPDADVSELLGRCQGRAEAKPIADAVASSDVVFLAVPGNVAVEAARSLGNVDGKVLVDCTNVLKWDAGPVWTPPPEGSGAAAIAKAVPGARVVKAFNTFGAEFHKNPKIGDQAADVYIAGDDADAKQLVAGIAERAGYTAVDAGPLRNAALLENLAILWIHLAMVGGKGRDFAFKILSR